ncbi:Hypothetical predicted protein [Paramuricea clavata]|uniref:Uncharacterized protein n=1 Tax=Paramuricea clavata TaxID=317549 RepID=A0A6S7L1J5_PARCT|nr:Hypothetical predicted protein [Paramuricea clavata]
MYKSCILFTFLPVIVGNNISISCGQRRSEDVPAALRRSFPTLASKSSSKSVKKPPGKKARKCNIVHKDLILLPTSTTRTVPTHQTRCQLENDGFVIHGCPIDKSWEESDLRNQTKEWFPILLPPIRGALEGLIWYPFPPYSRLVGVGTD